MYDQDFSFWEYDAYHQLWDVVIIGAGINGISTGISILERNPVAKVLIVDRWFVPLGASTRNAGFSCFGSPSEILSDVRTMGETFAVELVRQRWNGLQKLKERLNGSAAQYEAHGGYELFHKEEFDVIEPQLKYLNELLKSATGKVNVFSVTTVPEGIRGFAYAVFNPYEGQLHPVHMLEHLRKLFLKLGGKMLTGLNIESLDVRSSSVFLMNRVSLPLEAKNVVVATNAFVHDLIPDMDVQPARNHVLVTQPIHQLKWKGSFHFDEGYYYFRNIGNRILLGGARNQDFTSENTGEFGCNPVIVNALERFLYDHLADREAHRIEFQWSGIIATGKQKLPIIKSVSPRLHVGVRCSGMGIALASTTGEQLADLALQQ